MTMHNAIAELTDSIKGDGYQCRKETYEMAIQAMETLEKIHHFIMEQEASETTDGVLDLLDAFEFGLTKSKSDVIGRQKATLSVANDIAALALINIQDIFLFVLTAKDDEIEERYGTERTAIDIAERYLEIALKAPLLEQRLSGWSMKYSQPIKDSDDRIEHVARFYDVKSTGESEGENG